MEKKVITNIVQSFPNGRHTALIILSPDSATTKRTTRNHQRGIHLTAAAVGRVADTLALANVHAGFRVVGSRGAHALLDLASHGQESLLNVAGVLGGSLEEWDAQAVSEFLGNSVLDNLLIGHIALVAYEQLVDALGSIPVNLLEPLLDVVEGVHISDIVDDADAVSTAVVRRGDGSETLLAGGIPDLQLHGLAIEFYRSDLEIDTDGGDVRLGVGVIGKSQQQARLSNTGITDEEELEEVVVFGVHDGGCWRLCWNGRNRSGRLES